MTTPLVGRDLAAFALAPGLVTADGQPQVVEIADVRVGTVRRPGGSWLLGQIIHERLFAVELAEDGAPQLQEPGLLGN